MLLALEINLLLFHFIWLLFAINWLMTIACYGKFSELLLLWSVDSHINSISISLSLSEIIWPSFSSYGKVFKSISFRYVCLFSEQGKHLHFFRWCFSQGMNASLMLAMAMRLGNIPQSTDLQNQMIEQYENSLINVLFS